MLSFAGSLNPAWRILSMLPDSPGPDVFGLTVFVPTWPPTANATTTSASQPKVAVFQWPALQRPMRAARFECCFSRDMLVPPSFDNTADATSEARRGRRSQVGFELVPGDDSASSSGRRRRESTRRRQVLRLEAPQDLTSRLVSVTPWRAAPPGRLSRGLPQNDHASADPMRCRGR